ncbi:unnamed protein product [Chironomus riparius]|uniref:Serine/threonine-protein kinase ATR n=1 Tax=Chironomus riparius TaxID=315576 RepID=A0A9N9RWU0_9DIPT|nr:unnamed protein product [Chironomus riparius]
MVINDEIPIIVNISEVFDKNIVIEGAKVIKFEDSTISGLLDFIHNSFVILDENTSVVTSADQKNLLYRRLNWLFNKILVITIHDENARHSIKIRLLLEKMLQRTLNSFMYWFKCFLDLQLDLLNTTVTHDLSKEPIEIEIPGHDTDGTLNFSKIVIETESQINNFISFLFLSLTRCIELFPASIKVQKDVSIEDLLTKVFIYRRTECKTAVLLFCSHYYVNIHSIEFIDVSIKVFSYMSTIYENLDEYVESGMIYPDYFIDIFLKGFFEYLGMFLNHFKLPVNVLDAATSDMLIAAVMRLIFFESKWIQKYSVPPLTHWLVDLLDAIFLAINFDDSVVKYIDIIKPLSSKNSNMLLILKYKIILELESAENFDQKVRHMSKTWSEIQTDLALKTNFLLNNNQQLTNEQFMDQLQWIKDAIQITFDIDYHFTRRHQISHCMKYVCEYGSCKRFENTNKLFTFNDWDYDHIHLDFFDDLPSITHKLTLTVSKRSEFTTDILSILIRLYSLILQIPSTTLIKEDKRLMMLATVISPFTVSFDNFSKSAEYIKIQSFLNLKLKQLVQETPNGSVLDELKILAITAVTQMKFNKLGKSFEWLNLNLMQLIFKKEDKFIKKAYANRFINLLMTNFETMSTYLLHYQNIRLNNTKLELEELRNILCLHDKNVVIMKTISNNFFVFCSSCKPEIPIDHENSKEIRLRSLINDKKACIVSADFIDKKEVKIQIQPNLFNDQETLFYVEFIKNIPACIKHSKNFMDFCQSDRFFDIIFRHDENVFAQTDYHFEFIMKNIQESGLAEEVKTAFFEKLLDKLFELTTIYCQKSDVMKCQYHVVNMIGTYGMTVRNNVATYGNKFIPDVERISLKCIKMFIYFVVLKKSDVRGVAVNSMFRMLEYNGLVLDKFINWYKTSIIEHITKLCLLNSLEDSNLSTFLNSLINTLKHFNYTDIIKFIRTNISIIITSIFVFCVHSNKMHYIYAIIDHSGYDIRKALEISSLTLYERIYNLDKQRKDNCINYIEKEMRIMFKELFHVNKREILQFVLIKYNANPLFVMDVIKQLGDENVNLTDDDNIANYIAKDFLGPLNNFETILNSKDSEKTLKKAVLMSLGDLIRFLGGRRISNLCFKIMSLLRTTNTANKELKEVSIAVWKILIFNCDISTLGPFLSQILVALESYIDGFQTEVDEICIYLIFENSNLLSMHVSDLFFIEKTSFDIAIKNAILNQIESQRVADGNDFDINLNLMIRHLKNEHADSNVKIYCLQYLEEFIKRNRKKFNNLIFRNGEMDMSVKYLLDVLISCSKSFHNRKLQIQTAKCFGELGALKPALNKQQYLSKKIPLDQMTIHSDGFALKLLKVYCTYYKDMKETRHMESMALAIQGILKERGVNEKHIIWKSLPAFTRELFRPLFTSTYVPRETQASKQYETIFWNQAQTPTNWAFMLAGLLIHSIDVEETRALLLNLLPSMRENQEICNILLPRIILHYLQLNLSKDHDEAIFNEFDFIFRMVLDNSICQDASKDELNYKFVASYDFTPIDRKTSEENPNKVSSVSIKTTKMIFEVWDFLTRYLQITDNPDVIDRITHLFSRFENRKLAEVNYKCGEYERAMILFESYIKTLNEDQLENELPFLVNIYAKLKDPDLIEGVKALRITEWSFSDKILISEITGNLEGTFSFIEMMMKESSFSQEEIQTIINCYIKSNQNSTAILVADQLLERLYETNKEHQYCDEIKAESLWRLSRFDDFDDLLNSGKVSDWTNWNVVCGSLITKFRQEDINQFWNELENARMRVMTNFKISDSQEAVYQDNYSEIFHLHILSEFEKFQISFEDIKANKDFANTMKVLKNLIKELDSRKMVLQTSTPIIDTSLSIRRVMLLQMEKKLVKYFTGTESVQVRKFIEEEVGKTWIESVKITCKQKMFAQAHAFIMEADVYKPQELFIEKAKYYWMRDEKASALRILQLNCTEIEEYCKNNNRSPDYNEKQSLLSRGRLTIARFNAEVKNVDFDMNKKLYKDALLEDSFDVQFTHNEEIYVLLADYMDRHYFSKCKNSNELPAYDKLLEIMEAYGSSMKYGINYVLQSMPRFLQIWFDAMTSLERKSTNSKIKSRDDEEMELKINNYVKSIVKVLKPYYFYTAFSQLISRLCHPSYNVYIVLKMIITKLIEEYPLESMWFIMPNASSKSDYRKTRTTEILNAFSKERVRFANFNGVMEKIMCLAQRKQVDAEFMGSFCTSIEKLFKNVRILMPLQKHLQCVLSPSDNSFMTINSQVLICKIDKNVEIMKSLQQPKKITFIGSDGKEYPMLLKFKDDLRIDFRFMEFLKVINDFFNKDADASQRCLSARTYSVIPWNEDMGIIEWVPNLATFKGTVNEQYKKSKIKVPTNAELKKLSDSWLKTTQKHQFFNDMKKRFPPILGKWYIDHFSNVQNYFSARTNYIRSVAVMSMVGYIMGLGDRHMENILIDIHSGEIVHVDFACVFNKGESLGYPETVPFRLTQTMIEAMGPLGIEGPFRKCCEVALQLMQKEKNTLISYLRPFIYDPMITKKSSADHRETIDSAAMINLENVDKKLKGVVKKYKGSSGIALSSEGQVKFIIEEATSDENLAIMWFHWNPYI